MPAHYLTNAAGERTHVVLTLEEYELLKEQQAFAQADHRLADTDSDDIFPRAVVAALLADQPTLRVFRQFRGLTQAQLGAKAGLSKEYISLLEQGKREGTLAAWKSLAVTLDIELGLLVGEQCHNAKSHTNARPKT